MLTVDATERNKREISSLSAQEIALITSRDPNPEEIIMLNSLSGIEGLMLEKEH